MKRIQMPIKPEHLDELLAGYEKPEDLLGEVGLFKQLKKALRAGAGR
jgi:putative transposase